MTLMQSAHGTPDDAPTTGARLEFKWVGHGSWWAFDRGVPTDQPHHVVALVECVHQHVEVAWEADHRSVSAFSTLREAFDAIAATLH